MRIPLKWAETFAAASPGDDFTSANALTTVIRQRHNFYVLSIMKTTRLIAYAAAGIITGLLIENISLRARQKAGKKARQVKKDVSEGISRLKTQMH